MEIDCGLILKLGKGFFHKSEMGGGTQVSSGASTSNHESHSTSCAKDTTMAEVCQYKGYLCQAIGRVAGERNCAGASGTCLCSPAHAY